LPTANAAVNANTITAVKYENPCHTIAESRKRFSLGVNVVEPNCTTRNSRLYVIPRKGTNAAPTAMSSSVARLLSTVNPTGMWGTIRPSPSAART
jgi:hypothetical protein